MKHMKTWDELTIQDNYLFQKVMRLDVSLCRRLLERILGITIRKIDFPQTEKTIDTDFNAKSVRLDVYVEDDSGRVFDIEMQAADMAEEDLFLRTRYYQSMIDQGILEKGQVYSDLRESYIIFICAFDPFGLGLRRYTFRNRCDERPALALPDRAVRLFLNAKGRIGDETSDIRGFLDYINTNTATDGFAAELAAAVKQVKTDGVEKDTYMSLAMDIQRHIEKEKENWWAEGKAEGLAEGKAEGLAEGKAEGLAEGKAEIALAMLQMNMSVEQIAKLTGLSVTQVQ